MKAEIHFRLDDDGIPSGFAEGKAFDLVALLLAFSLQGEDETNVLLIAAGAGLEMSNNDESKTASEAIARVTARRLAGRVSGKTKKE